MIGFIIILLLLRSYYLNLRPRLALWRLAAPRTATRLVTGCPLVNCVLLNALTEQELEKGSFG